MRRHVTGPGEVVEEDAFGLPPEETVAEERPDAEAFSWLAFYGDGRHRLLEVAEITGIAPLRLAAAFGRLEGAGVLERIVEPDEHPDRTVTPGGSR